MFDFFTIPQPIYMFYLIRPDASSCIAVSLKSACQYVRYPSGFDSPSALITQLSQSITSEDKVFLELRQSEQ